MASIFLHISTSLAALSRVLWHVAYCFLLALLCVRRCHCVALCIPNAINQMDDNAKLIAKAQNTPKQIRQRLARKIACKKGK